MKLLSWVSPEWIKGEIDGELGSFPAAFVDILEDVIIYIYPLRFVSVCSTFWSSQLRLLSLAHERWLCTTTNQPVKAISHSTRVKLSLC